MVNFFKLFTLVCLLSNLSFSQNISVDYSLEHNLDLFHVKEPLKLWLDFLNTSDDIDGAKFWNKKAIEKYGNKDYFQLNDLDYFELGDKVRTLQYGTTVLGITKVDSIFKITSQLRIEYNDSVSTTPFIFYVYAMIDENSNELKLYNPLAVNQRLYMKSTKVKNITYIYPEEHKFNKLLALKQYKVLKNISKEFDIPLNEYSFFFTNSRSSYYHLKGYDFHFENNGVEYPSGKADVDNSIVYSFGTNEYYPHELIHLLVNKKWANTHLWFQEGFATYFGGSRGKSLDFHIEKLKVYLKNNPNLKMEDLLKMKNLDDETGFRYVIGGLFVKIAYENGGAHRVLNLMSKGLSDEDFVKTLEETFNIKGSQIDSFFKKNLFL